MSPHAPVRDVPASTLRPLAHPAPPDPEADLRGRLRRVERLVDDLERVGELTSRGRRDVYAVTRGHE